MFLVLKLMLVWKQAPIEACATQAIFPFLFSLKGQREFRDA